MTSMPACKKKAQDRGIEAGVVTGRITHYRLRHDMFRVSWYSLVDAEVSNVLFR